jgi:hypothetical protein
MRRAQLSFHLAIRDEIEFVFNSGHALAYPMHTHVSTYTLTTVRRGAVRLMRGDAAHTYPAGRFYAVAPHEPHSPAYTDDFDIVSLCVNKAHFQGLSFPALKSLCLPYMQVLAAKGLLSPEDVRALLDCAETAYRTRALSPESFFPLPDRVPGMNPSHFIRRFKRETGLTPHQFLVQNRIREAKKLLAGPASIAEAALQAGFCDQSHLNRWFGRNLGITPRQYKKSCFFLDGLGIEGIAEMPKPSPAPWRTVPDWQG